MENVVHLTGRLEPRGKWKADRCSIAKAVEVLSTRSAFLILREAFYGTTRFDEFAERVGITDAVAAARLRELVEGGLLERVPYQEPGQRTRHRYRLTAKGADLFPALVALMQWGDRWLNDGGRVELQHRDCGASVGVEVRCEAGHRVEPADLDLAVKKRRRPEGGSTAPAVNSG
jgi:DNA-binding HxlR family transcriptional regulator